jgi:hypothetical protein
VQKEAPTFGHLCRLATEAFATNIDRFEWCARIKDLLVRYGFAYPPPHRLTVAMDAVTRARAKLAVTPRRRKRRPRVEPRAKPKPSARPRTSQPWTDLQDLVEGQVLSLELSAMMSGLTPEDLALVSTPVEDLNVEWRRLRSDSLRSLPKSAARRASCSPSPWNADRAQDQIAEWRNASRVGVSYSPFHADMPELAIIEARWERRERWRLRVVYGLEEDKRSAAA